MADLNASLQASSRLNLDTLSSIPRYTALKLGHEFMEALGQRTGEDLLAATAVAFAVLGERFSGGPEALHDYGRRILNEPAPYDHKGNATRDALRDYAALKVRTDPRI